MNNLRKRLDDLEAAIKPADPEQPRYLWLWWDDGAVRSSERPEWADDYDWLELPALDGITRFICAADAGELARIPRWQPGQVLRGYADGSYEIDDGPRIYPDEL